MNKYLIILSLLIVFQACQQKDEIPTDLAGKKTYLSTKKTELYELQKVIDDLTEEIEILEPKKKSKAILVSLDTINTTEFKQFVEVQAMVVAEDYVNASSETGGRLISMNVNEGDYVSRGKLIATVDLESLEKQLSEVQISYDLAKTVFERQKRLWDQNIGSELQFIEAKSNKERLEKSMETIRTNLKKKNVYAPISGYVDKEFVQSGEMTSPGMPIVSILNTSKVKVVADLPEKYLGSIKRGDVVDLEFPAIQKSMKSKISMMGRSIDPANRTFKVELNANNSSGKLKPNLLAKVSLNNYTNKEALVLPTDLILQDVTGNKFVFTVLQKDTSYFAKQVYVETGESYDNTIEITTGLKSSDIIVVEGARSLVDGNEVIF